MPNDLIDPPAEPTEPPRRRPGRPPKLTADEQAKLIAYVRENPQATVDQMCAWVKATLGKSVDRVTVVKYLKLHGIAKRRPPKLAATTPEVHASASKAAATDTSIAIPKKRYGYKEFHRTGGSEDTYPSSTTDAKWARIEHLFVHTGVGKPPEYERRVLLDAMLYVVRGGVAWRMMPKGFPPWENVYATFVSGFAYPPNSSETRKLRHRAHRRGAVAAARPCFASRCRYDSPPMASTVAWCVSRSTMVATQAAVGNTSCHRHHRVAVVWLGCPPGSAGVSPAQSRPWAAKMAALSGKPVTDCRSTASLPPFHSFFSPMRIWWGPPAFGVARGLRTSGRPRRIGIAERVQLRAR